MFEKWHQASWIDRFSHFLVQASMASRQVVIALGSNLGDRGRNAWWAVQQLMQNSIQILRCSALYETAAAYVTDQPAFLNAAVLASTPLSPRDLLSTLKGIEAAAGRDLESGPRYGPRPLDLDIVFSSDQPYQDDMLSIPHARWHERDFVLRPVSDLWYTSTDEQQQTTTTSTSTTPFSLDPALRPMVCKAHRWAVKSQGVDDGATSEGQSTGLATAGGQGAVGSGKQSGVDGEIQVLTLGGVMRRVTPIGKGGRLLTWGERTLVMGILNVTPDSFSDGGSYLASAPAGGSAPAHGIPGHGPAVDMDVVVRTASQMAADGADIIDVGGQSTRPGAPQLGVEEELKRVIPVIRALRSCADLDAVAISVDTFYSEVARQSVLSGADIVNDVSGGVMDPNMRHQVAALGVPFVVMHMRGDPTTMHHAANTRYQNDLASEVGRELQQTLDLAVRAGIPAWNIITDPGIGFAKTSEGNWDLIRGLRWPLRDHELQGAFRHGPMLVGPSRKGFLGKVMGRQVPAREREAATVAAVVACVEKGADMVRVHNVKYGVDGVRVADRVYRGR